jgi:UDP-galactopyranose mutase
MEEWCLSAIGRTLYETFIEGYSTKQWNKHPRELPATIVKRLPVRFTFNDDYFHDLTYQGIPIGGYTRMVDNMLDFAAIERGQKRYNLKPGDHYEPMDPSVSEFVSSRPTFITLQCLVGGTGAGSP